MNPNLTATDHFVAFCVLEQQVIAGLVGGPGRDTIK